MQSESFSHEKELCVYLKFSMALLNFHECSRTPNVQNETYSPLHFQDIS